MLHYQTIALEVKEIDERDGSFEGWAAEFDVEDDGGDTIKRGAFKKSLAVRMPKLYLEHMTSVGVLNEATEKKKGLWVAGKPDDSPDGLAARAKLKSGALDALSIGYRTVTAKETGAFKRDLIEVKLFHVGIVPFGMQPGAVVTSVKALDLEDVHHVRDLEVLLREAGFSRKAAKMLCSTEYIAKLTQSDSDEGAAKLAAALERAAATLRQ